MWILYDLAFLVFSLFSLPRLLRRQWLKTLPERLGRLPSSVSQPSSRPRLWLHAVSLGEALAARPLIERLRREFPETQLLFSTTTLTGRSAMERFRKPDEPLFYFPFDLGLITRRVLRQIRPTLFVTMETELWPNLFLELRRQGVPAVVVNGRLSGRSFRNYRRIRLLLRSPLEAVHLFCMQTQEDASRIESLGISRERIEVVGNMKFDAFRSQTPVDLEALRRRLGLTEKDFLWVAGSTHRGEEGEILEAFRRLRESYPALRLLLAPRHPERSQEVARLSGQKNLESFLVSALDSRLGPASPPVLILDTVGELSQLYRLATVVFIGGSLVPHGGQNLLEPAFFARPILFGPHMENFKDITAIFLKHQAACQVRDRSELVEILQQLLEKEEKRHAMGERARRLIEEQQGATERTVIHLRRLVR